MTTIRNVSRDVEFLLNPIICSLERLRGDISSRVDGVIILVGGYGTENFALFSYLSILKHKNGGEISITVSVDIRDDCLSVDSDVCDSSGHIILDGPKLMEGFVDWPSSRMVCDVWLERFCNFLSENLDTIVDEARKLPDEGAE